MAGDRRLAGGVRARLAAPMARCRRFLLVTHRWVGVASAGVLVIASATGALLAWPWPGESGLWRPVAARIHENLGLGLFGIGALGYWTVTIASAMGALLVCGGLLLWWQRKIVRVRTDLGWRRAAFDLHQVVGFFGSGVMLLLAVTGIGVMFLRPDDGMIFEVTFALHTARNFHWSVKMLYLVGTTAFTVQTLTGFLIWWRPARAA